MKAIANWFNGLGKIWKILLVIFLDGIFGGAVRFCGSKTISKVVGVVQFVLFIMSIIGLAAIPFGWIFSIFYFIIWICDLVTVIMTDKITVLAD